MINSYKKIYAWILIFVSIAFLPTEIVANKEKTDFKSLKPVEIQKDNLSSVSFLGHYKLIFPTTILDQKLKPDMNNKQTEPVSSPGKGEPGGINQGSGTAPNSGTENTGNNTSTNPAINTGSAESAPVTSASNSNNLDSDTSEINQRGGGHTLIRGDIKLKMSKMIAIDGGPFINSEALKRSISITKKRPSALLTYKITLTNTGAVSIINLKLKQQFDPGESGLNNEPVINVTGASLNPVKKEFTIKKIPAGQSVEFTYSYKVIRKSPTGMLPWLMPSAHADERETGARDFLIIDSYDTRLAPYQDGLNYSSIGDSSSTYLSTSTDSIRRSTRNRSSQNTVTNNISDYSYNGTIENEDIGKDLLNTESEGLKMYVVSNKSEVEKGDQIKFMIILENRSRNDFNNIILTHHFAKQALTLINTSGGRSNGQEITWNRSFLRSGEKATYEINARVKNNAPIAITRGITRILLNEFDFSSQIENYFNIVSSAKKDNRIQSSGLAATGPMGIVFYLILLALIGNLGYRYAQDKRYTYRKRLALSGI